MNSLTKNAAVYQNVHEFHLTYWNFSLMDKFYAYLYQHDEKTQFIRENPVGPRGQWKVLGAPYASWSPDVDVVRHKQPYNIFNV